MNQLDRGIAVIQGFVKNLPEKPGVYRMLDGGGDVLYVGKAKSLKSRVSSYTQRDRLTVRLKRMVSQTVSMEFVHTNTEAEALLMEANLIKELKPYYNIRLMDDKFFAYIHVSDHPSPRLYKYRGNRRKGGIFLGPLYRLRRSRRPWNPCIKSLRSDPVGITFLKPANAPVCNITLNAARPLVLTM